MFCTSIPHSVSCFCSNRAASNLSRVKTPICKRLSVTEVQACTLASQSQRDEINYTHRGFGVPSRIKVFETCYVQMNNLMVNGFFALLLLNILICVVKYYCAVTIVLYCVKNCKYPVIFTILLFVLAILPQSVTIATNNVEIILK